jgi:hypothetical protein
MRSWQLQSKFYAGLRAGASPEAVLARAEVDGAPFTAFDDCRA